MKLLGISNTKTLKGESLGYRTYIMHLAPSTLSGYQVCPMASLGCSDACLNLSGMGRFSNVQAARIAKTQWFFQDRPAFMKQLVKEVRAAVKSSHKAGLTPVFRLNGTSDIRWEMIPVLGDAPPTAYASIMAMFPQVQFYDYTKIPNRRNVPSNYHLTFSRSETNHQDVVLSQYNVAVVFDTLPDTYLGRPVIDGTETDLRFLDPQNVVVGLKANGKAKKDTSGFTVFTRKVA
jgi:hypothetical protein